MREERPDRPSIFATTNKKTGFLEIHLSERELVDLLEALNFAHASASSALKMLTAVPDMAPEKIKNMAAMVLIIDDTYQKIIAQADPGSADGCFN